MQLITYLFKSIYLHIVDIRENENQSMMMENENDFFHEINHKKYMEGVRVRYVL